MYVAFNNMIRKLFNLTSSLFLFLTQLMVSSYISELSEAYQNSVCPAPLPCHCVKNDKVFCAFMRLKELPYMDFQNVWDILDLSENFLDHLPSNGFNGVKVRILNLSRNSIHSIDTQAFNGIVHLEHLDLSFNNLRTVPQIFSTLPELKSLKLCYNHIKSLPYDTFEDSSKTLQELDLTGNDLESIPTEALLLLTGLRRLILRQNRLKKIDAYAFNDLPIEMLDLGDNRARLEIHDEAFCGLQPTVLRSEPGVTDWSGMITLVLDHNGLTTLTPCVTKLIWTLHTIDLSGNPIHCGCDIFTLKDFSSKTEFPGAQCATPDPFAGHFMNAINHTRYSCPSNKTAQACKRLCRSPPPAAYRGKANKVFSFIDSISTSSLILISHTYWILT